ncbi:MAG: ABC transporter ATP-binding protein [Planctomycetes bacterium]|nr:ABC transporter ATP-binding protein [Planctomycetota bacterium]MCB9918008.1 ABC transporter ATP-binding protein [Planctomycetota bacterium]
MDSRSDPGSEQSVVRLCDLGKVFGSFVAVDRLSFDVSRGEILALLGPNGAGKTTTIRMLMGILAPSSGTVSIFGLDCFEKRAAVMAHVGYLPDEPMFYEHLTGGEVVRFCGSMRGMDPREVVRRTEELAGRLEFADALDEYALNYSMGMKKKLALVCAMLHAPRVLILDEPTNGLDPIVTRTMIDLLRELANDGTSILYSTHLIEQAAKLCDRVAILHHGRLAALGAPDDLRAGGSLEDAFFTVTGDVDRMGEGPDRGTPVADAEV